MERQGPLLQFARADFGYTIYRMDLFTGSGQYYPVRSHATDRLTNRRLRILIADDQPIIRRMVRSTLEAHAHFEVCDEATDGAQAIEKAKEIKPDVVVLNVTMPVLNGFEAARRIKKHLPETAIVILSSNADKYFLEEAKKIGVRAYVAKTKVGEALVKAIEAAVEGNDFFVLE